MFLDDDEDDFARGGKLHHQVGDPVGVNDAPQPHENVPPPLPAPAPAPQPPEPHRSGRSRVPAEVWQPNWHKASYNPADHRVPAPAPPAPLVPDPVPPFQLRHFAPPAVDSSGSGSDSDDEESPNPPSADEAHLTETEVAFLTYPEACEVVFKAAAHDNAPNSYAEAMRRPDAQKWHDAAHEEIKALIEHGTWELARLPPGCKAIGCRWVFVIK